MALISIRLVQSIMNSLNTTLRKPGLWQSMLVIVLLLASILIGMVVLPRVAKRSHPMVGKPAPTLQLPLLMHAENIEKAGVNIGFSRFKGKVVVLDFWAPWCMPCRQTMPELNQLARKLEPEGVIVLGILVDQNRLSAREFLTRANITYPQFDDEHGIAEKSYQIRSLPSLVILNRKGDVSAYRVGALSSEELEASIRRAM